MSFGRLRLVFHFFALLRTLRSRVLDRKEALRSNSGDVITRAQREQTDSFALKIRENGQNPAEIRACTKK